MSKFNQLFNLFRQAKNMADKGDNPHVTNFLKNSSIFRTIALKIHDLKNNVVDKMDDIAFK